MDNWVIMFSYNCILLILSMDTKTFQVFKNGLSGCNFSSDSVVLQCDSSKMVKLVMPLKSAYVCKSSIVSYFLCFLDTFILCYCFMDIKQKKNGSLLLGRIFPWGFLIWFKYSMILGSKYIPKQLFFHISEINLVLSIDTNGIHYGDQF